MDAVSGMHSLKKAWMEDELLSEPPIMSHLASLSTLEELCMDSHYSFPDTIPPQTTRRFSSLRRLYLTGLSAIEPSGSFLSAIDPVSLQSLTLLWIHSFLDECTGGRYLHDYIHILSTTGALRLEHIKATMGLDEQQLEYFLIGRGMPPEHLRPLPEGARYLRSLCDLTSLRSIVLEIDVVIQLSDDFLVQLASSLPQLEHLSLVPGILYAFKIAEEADIPTFHGLLALVEHCPRLAVIKLAVRTALSMESGATTRDPPRVLLSSSSMRVLDLFTTPVGNVIEPGVVSAFIIFTFPNLERFRVVLPATGEGFTLRERWDACAQWSCIMEDVLIAQKAGGKDVDQAGWYVK